MKTTNVVDDDSRIWIDYEASMTLAGCTKRFHRNQTFICNLESMFEHLCAKFELLCNYRKSFHFFVNPSLVIEGSFKEAHLIAPSLLSTRKPCYQQLRLTESDEKILNECIEREKDRPDPRMVDLTKDDLLRLLSVLKIDAEPDAGILIPFNYGVNRINMGYFVLWKRNTSKIEPRRSDDETLRGWVETYYTFLQSFLTREYPIFPKTYLPSFYSARWAKAAILFADIRNFTPLTEVLRNAYAHALSQDTKVFREIMDEHCREMATIIQRDGRGRIDKFLGDGIMAIFGEHEPNPSAAVCRAVAAAVSMVQRFDELKSGFLKTAFGGGYETEYNESVELQLGVGIDFGTVLFEYLGDDQHREYTAVGDHVNFAQRLESQAARLDDRNAIMPPILISATAERCIRPWLNRVEVKEVIVNPKGKGRYKVFGLNKQSFHRELYDLSEQHHSWIQPWGNYAEGPPEVQS